MTEALRAIADVPVAVIGQLLRRASNVEKRLSLSLTHPRALRPCTVVLTSSLTGASASCTAASATTQDAMRAPPGLNGSDTQEAVELT